MKAAGHNQLSTEEQARGGSVDNKEAAISTCRYRRGLFQNAEGHCSACWMLPKSWFGGYVSPPNTVPDIPGDFMRSSHYYQDTG